MAITQEQLEDILGPLIKRIIALEERFETEVSTSNERNPVEVVDNLSQIKNPVNGTIAINRADNKTYYFDVKSGWIVTVV